MGKRIISISINKTKTMQKQHKNSQKLFKSLRSTPFLVIASLLTVSLAVGAPLVRADQFDDQINALRAQNSDAQGSLSSLVAQASSYQDTINQLQAQISAIQQAIAANEAQQAQLQDEIVQDQQQIDQQKAV